MIILDLETTGLSITKDRIVQIAILKDGEMHETLINPTIPIPKEASEIHGITDNMVKSSPTFKQVSKYLMGLLKGCDLAGYNSDNYDIPLLMEEFNRVGMELDLSHVKTFDIYKIECKLNPRDLASVYNRRTGKTLDDAHSASSDVRATEAIFNEQLKILTIEQIHEDDDRCLDLTRKLIATDDGEVAWNFGKNKGKPIVDDISYCNWVLKGDFTKQVKDIIKECIK